MTVIIILGLIILMFNQRRFIKGAVTFINEPHPVYMYILVMLEVVIATITIILLAINYFS